MEILVRPLYSPTEHLDSFRGRLTSSCPSNTSKLDLQQSRRATNLSLADAELRDKERGNQ